MSLLLYLLLLVLLKSVFPILNILPRIYDSTEEVAIIAKWKKNFSPDPYVGGLRLDPCLLGTWWELLCGWKEQASAATCRICVQSAAVTSGELYHSSLKNMQIVMLDYFLCQLFFLDPIRARSCSYLPEHHATKYNNTSDTIVTLTGCSFHDCCYRSK